MGFDNKDFESWESIETGSCNQNGPSPRQRRRRQADARYKRNKPTDDAEIEGLEND